MPDLRLLLRYLREWLIRHIDGPDKELGRGADGAGDAAACRTCRNDTQCVG